MAKRKKPQKMTAEELAQREETQRMVRERIAYHEAKAREEDERRAAEGARSAEARHAAVEARTCHHDIALCYHDGMVRTQIQLTGEQAAAVKRIAAQRGVSMAAVIRDAVDGILDGDERRARWERALSVVGSASGGGENVSEEHDRYLEEAFLDWRRS